jgi:multimeric flavodoxin WrbA
MITIGIIIGSTRPGRVAPQVANWFYKEARQSQAAHFELIDIRDFNLPLLDEDRPAKVSKEHTKKWSATIDRLDGFVFVTAEHNNSFPASLKNAIDYLNSEWSYKPVAYVAYGFALGHLCAAASWGMKSWVFVLDTRSCHRYSSHDRVTRMWQLPGGAYPKRVDTNPMRCGVSRRPLFQFLMPIISVSLAYALAPRA